MFHRPRKYNLWNMYNSWYMRQIAATSRLVCTAAVCDKSLRQCDKTLGPVRAGEFGRREMWTSSNLTWRQDNWCSLAGWFKFFVAATCRRRVHTLRQGCMRLLWRCDMSQHIATTKFCRSDNDFHMSQEAICCSCRNLLCWNIQAARIWQRTYVRLKRSKWSAFCKYLIRYLCIHKLVQGW